MIKVRILLKLFLMVLIVSAFVPISNVMAQDDAVMTEDSQPVVVETVMTDSEEGDAPEVLVADKPHEAFDILKPLNHLFYWINHPIYLYIVRPIAAGYQYVLYRPVRHGINNFFNNIITPFSALNNLFQGKGGGCGNEFARFGLNTTVGILGFMEVAEPKFGYEPMSEDFGQTFGKWGIPQGPYLVLPLLGPTTLSDLISTFTKQKKTQEWYHNEKVGPIRVSPGLSIFALNGASLTYNAYHEICQITDEKDISQYKFLRNNYVDARYRLSKDLPPRTEPLFLIED